MAFFLIFFFIGFLHAEIVEVHRIEEMLPFVDEETWVVFDVNTILKPEFPLDTVLIQQVQHSAGAVFGLAALYPPLCPAVLKQLAYIGIDFTFSAPLYPVIEAKLPARWEEGVFFLTDFNRKETVFRKWLELSEVLPKKILFIDEGRHNLIEMEYEMAQIGIPCTCLHYER